MSKLLVVRHFSAGLVMACLGWLLCGCSHKSGQGAAPDLTIFYNAEEQPAEKSSVAQVLQSQLVSHEVKVTLDPVTNSIFYDRLGKGQFQATLALWYLDYDDPEGFLTDFYSQASFRMAKYSNPAFDRAYQQGIYAPNAQEKLKHFREAIEILQRDLPWIPLYSNNEIFFLKHGAEEFHSNAYQYYDYRRVSLKAIRAASDIEIQTFDPALAYDLASKHVVCQSYEGLIALDESAKIVPALATSWSFSKENDALTFHVRPNVLFHKSAAFQDNRRRQLTAADVKASYERMLKSNSPYSYVFDYVKGVQEFRSGKADKVEGFRVLDPLTFRIEMTRPFPTMLPWLLAPAAYVLPRDLPKDFDFTKTSLGTGPFVLTSYDGSVAKFERNGEYWLRDDQGKQLPRASTFSVRVIKDVNTVLTAFRHDDLDILNVPMALYGEVFEKDGSIRTAWRGYGYREVRLNNLKFLCFNMQAAPWGTRVELRRQVEASLDREAIVRELFRGKARAANSVIPSEMLDSLTASSARVR